MKTSMRAVFAVLGSFAFAQFASGALPRLTERDYIEIQQLNARYVYAVDNCTNNGLDYANLYTEDGTFGVSQAWGTEGRVFAKGREALARAGGGGKDGCVERPKTSPVYGIHHIATSLVITPTVDGAIGKSTLLAIGVGGNPTMIEWQGGYEDFYVRTGLGWRIKSRWHVWIGMESSVQYKDMQRATAAAAAAAPGAITAAAAAPAAPPAPPQPNMRGDGPPPPARPFSITRSQAGMDAVVAPNAKLELLASGFGLNEGPVWVREGKSGYLLVSGLLDNVIYKIAQDKTVSVYVDKAGYSGTDIENVGAQTRKRYLYLSALSKLMRYEVNADGSLGTGTLFAEGPGIGDGIKVDTAGNVFSTGGAGPGTVRVMSREGQLLGMINLPVYGGEPKRQICATNVAFGGNDGKSLFITACDAVYRLPLK